MVIHISRPMLWLAALLLASAPTARAQSTLDERMRGFLGAVGKRTLPDSVAAFFPRRGDWTWVQTLVDPPAVRGVGTWRFPGAETRRAMEPGAPLCYSIAWAGGDYGPWEGALVMQVMVHDSGWRRVTPTRYVPPGAAGDSPHFVEWRREDGRWVISAIGDEVFHWTPPQPGPDLRPNQVTRDTISGGNATELAAAQPWYLNNEMIHFGGYSYIKYGLPRRIGLDELRRIGSLGTVPVYVEAGPGWRGSRSLYLPVRPGELQPYVNELGSSCDP